MNIYVGNLPFSTTDDELKEIFTEYGQVLSAKIIMDRETGRSKGFGFVEMSDSNAEKAISELDEAELNGKKLTVNEAKPKKENFGGNSRGRGNYGGGGGGNSRRSW
jgi:cold-inducible RNA-binding protein